MAKSKKSKILAMALCASVMTGIYAAPVMAAGQVTGLKDSTGAVLTADDTVSINGVKLEILPGGMHGRVEAAGGTFTQLTVTNGMEITGGVLTVGGTSIDSTTGNTKVVGTLTADGAANLNGGLTVTGDATVNGKLTAADGLEVTNHGIKVEEGGLTVVEGATNIQDGLSVSGETTLEKTTVNGTLTAGATTVDSLGVTNNATVNGTLTAGANC